MSTFSHGDVDGDLDICWNLDAAKTGRALIEQEAKLLLGWPTVLPQS